MTKRKEKTRPEGERPPPTLPVQEIMRENDGRHLLILGDDLIKYMPERYKNHIRNGQTIIIEVEKYSIQICKASLVYQYKYNSPAK